MEMRIRLRVIFAIAVCAISPALFAEGEIKWRETRTMSAEEAHQAAAADEQFVYAVASDRIAKYDRKTGKRAGVSTGEAKHLNSGFLFKGKLLCAHSNYPRVPERSEIKQLDTGTMQLTTLHDFGNYGGSLTWVVRYRDHWWCNFARYGAANAETFLAEFDEDWKELGRWTYPVEVIREIGTYSLSGGLWRGDDLLVTDHDHGVLYRLRLPKRGTLLKFAGKEPAPFTGQGIALDPATGGLVGINRAKRLIVFAESD